MCVCGGEDIQVCKVVTTNSVEGNSPVGLAIGKLAWVGALPGGHHQSLPPFLQLAQRECFILTEQHSSEATAEAVL